MLDSRTSAVGGGAVPKLDLYHLMVQAGQLPKAADWNDWTADGNQRVLRDDTGRIVTLNDRGSLTVDGREADLGPIDSTPDGIVDMRDFRRLRDAWLYSCLEGSAGAPTQPTTLPSCPLTITTADLDGGANHPKRDGNLDRCVGVIGANPRTCGALESESSRFDLNGDYRFSLWDPSPVRVRLVTRACSRTGRSKAAT